MVFAEAEQRLTRMLEQLQDGVVQLVHVGFGGRGDEDGVIARYGAEDPF